MSIGRDAISEKIQLQSICQYSKLAKAVNDQILSPILDKIADQSEEILHDVGEKIVMLLKARILGNSPSGEIYHIMGWQDGKSTKISEHRVSSAGEPPAQLTGTLVNSIDFKFTNKGAIRVGIFEQKGDPIKSLFYIGRDREKGLPGRIFTSSEAKATPVTEYAEYLEEGTAKMAPRPWLHYPLQEMKADVRAILRKEMKTRLKKITRRISVRKAFYFRVYIH